MYLTEQWSELEFSSPPEMKTDHQKGDRGPHVSCLSVFNWKSVLTENDNPGDGNDDNEDDDGDDGGDDSQCFVSSCSTSERLISLFTWVVLFTDYIKPEE